MSKTIEINGVVIDPQKYIDKWIKWSLDATPATDEQVIQNVKTLYRKANLAEPTVHVYRSYEKFLGINWDFVRDSVWDSVRDSVWDSVGASVRASVRDSVWDSVRDSVWASVWASVGDSVRDSVWASVWASVGASVRGSVWDSVRDSVGASVWASVGASVRASVGASVGAWNWADNLSFADVFVDTNVLSKEKAQKLEEYKKILETQRLAVLTKTDAYVLVAPTIRRNDDGQLHSDQRPAVEWEDKTGQYYLDGVNMPKDMWQKIISKEMSFSEIMKIEIADQRTVALRYNPEAIIKEQAKLVNKDDRNNELYLIEGQEINRITNYPKMYFLKMLCPTGRVFVEGVDPKDVEELGEDANALQAKALGLIKSEYVELLLES